MVLQAAWFFALIPALTIGAHLHGIDGVGEGHVVVALGVVLPVTLWALRRTGLAPLAVVNVLARSVVLAALAGGVAVFGTRLVSGPFARCAVGGSSGAAAALLVVGVGWQWGRRRRGAGPGKQSATVVEQLRESPEMDRLPGFGG